MAGPRKKTDLRALRNLISEADLLLSTTELPEGRSQRAHELLQAAVALADQLLSVRPAAVLGQKGGKKTAERGPEYFRKIAAMRKTKAGGRPRKNDGEMR
jgi:hypothetical protein